MHEIKNSRTGDAYGDGGASIHAPDESAEVNVISIEYPGYGLLQGIEPNEEAPRKESQRGPKLAVIRLESEDCCFLVFNGPRIGLFFGPVQSNGVVFE